MKLRQIYITLWAIISITLKSQDLHFSQFYENPSLLNPALTGATAPMRISINHKDQWRSITNTYRTFGASFETRINPDRWPQPGKIRPISSRGNSLSGFAAGLSCYTDKAGDGNLGLTQANLSLASLIQISKQSYLTVGLQAGLAQRKIDNARLIFPSQYNGTGYDASMATRENFQNSNFTVPDIAAGTMWSYAANEKKVDASKQLKINLGFALYHIINIRQNYLATGYQSYKKFILHGDIFYNLPGKQLALAPSFLFQKQGPSNEFLIGSFLKYYMDTDSRSTGIIKKNSLGLGVHYRNKDAIIISTLLEWQERFAVIMSYDLNVSRLIAASTMRGGFEITLRYTPLAEFLNKKKPSSE